MAAGQEIKRLRGSISVEKVANLIGVNAGRLRKWEQRDADPKDSGDIAKIEAYFGVPIKELPNLDNFQFLELPKTKNPGQKDQDLETVNEFLLKKVSELEAKVSGQDQILKEFTNVKISLNQLKHDGLNVAAMMFAFQEYWIERSPWREGTPDEAKKEIFERALAYLGNFEKEGIHVAEGTHHI